MSTDRDVTESGGGGSKLDRAKSRRRDLHLAMAAMEAAVAGPTRDEDAWLAVVRPAMDALRDALRTHVDEVEAPDGLLDDIVTQNPRLTVMAEELKGEHPELLASLERVNQALASDAVDRRQVRRRVVALLGRLAMHRQAGADLVYEAYQVDIGGQG